LTKQAEGFILVNIYPREMHGNLEPEERVFPNVGINTTQKIPGIDISDQGPGLFAEKFYNPDGTYDIDFDTDPDGGVYDDYTDPYGGH